MADKSLDVHAMSACRAWLVAGLCGLLLLSFLSPAPALGQTPASASGDSVGGPRTAGFDPVVTIVNGLAIRRSEVVDAAQALPKAYHNLPLEMVYPVLLERLIDVKLIASEGRQAKLDNDPVVLRRVAEQTERIIQEVYLARLVEGRITENGLRRRYNDFLKENPPSEEARVRHILVGNRQRATELLGELQGGADFAALATEWSIGPEREQGGDLGWISRADMVGDFVEVAFALSPGETAKEPLRTNFGWHVIKLEQKRPVPPPTFDELRGRLVAQWSQEIIESLMTGLREKADIQRFDLVVPKGTVGGERVVPGTLPGQPAAGLTPSGLPRPAGGTATQ